MEKAFDELQILKKDIPKFIIAKIENDLLPPDFH